MKIWIRFGAGMMFVFLAGLTAQSGFFDGLEQGQGDDFLQKTSEQVDEDARVLSVRLTKEEALGLSRIVDDVNLLLSKDEKGFLEKDFQDRILGMEKEWRKREGAWGVVRLLESIRIKSALYVQNAYFLKRLSVQSPLYQETFQRVEKYHQGVKISNESLEEMVSEGIKASGE